METGRIKTFAIESRKILKEGVMQRIRALGFDEQGRTPDVPEKVQGGTRYQGRIIESERFYDAWVALNEHIRRVGVKAVYEEAAYTWFNRLMAIRIMQKNNFIEPVLSYDDPEIRIPHIVSEARRGHRLCNLTTDEQERLRRLLMDDTKTLEQFSILIIAYCRENKVISKCFGGIALYLELLLPEDILSQNRFIDLLNNTSDYITDEQFRSAELIGWLYQFYISEKKDEVFASFKKGKKAEAEDIPAATQIFTPNWIVKYMVQNTVGRIYLDNNPYCPLKKDWKYLVEPTEKTPKEAILNIDDLADLTLADLACGSGHILVEGFDILYSLYIDEGYSRYDAIKNIFTKNLTGIDLDTRAKQLATFALLLKAAQIDSTFLNAEVMPRVYDMPKVDRYTWRDLNGHMTCALQIEGANEQVSKELDACFTLMEQAQNLGSIMKFDISESTRAYIIKCIEEQARQHKFEDSFADLFHGFHIILALTEKYAALAMNPPYMGQGNMNSVLSNYVKKNYEKGKADLFSSFMIVAINRLVERGKYGMINMHSWMFLSSFEGLRREILDNQQIDNLLHLGPRTFDELTGEVVQNSAFVITKFRYFSCGCYFRLVNGNNCKTKEDMFLEAQVNHNTKIYYPNVFQGSYEKISGIPFGYWISNRILDLFKNKTLGDTGDSKQGMATGDNARFLRIWQEVSYKKIKFDASSNNEAICSGYKWYPHNKGGNVKWYGDNLYIIAFDRENYNALLQMGNHLPSRQLYFKSCISWSVISSTQPLFRYIPNGYTFNMCGMSYFRNNEDELLYSLGYANSKLFNILIPIVNPTINLSNGDFARMPYCAPKSNAKIIVKNNIAISKQDWDAHETSWDFEKNELIRMRGRCEKAGRNPNLMEDCYRCYQEEWTEKFNQLHENEEELNRQFIEIYGLEDELTPDVPLDEITILQQGEITIE